MKTITYLSLGIALLVFPTSCQKEPSSTEDEFGQEVINEEPKVSATFYYDIKEGDLGIQFNSVSGLDLDATFELKCVAKGIVSYWDGDYAYPAVYELITEQVEIEAKPYFGSARTDRYHVAQGEKVKLFPINDLVSQMLTKGYESYEETESRFWHEKYTTVYPIFSDLTISGDIHFFKTKEQLKQDIFNGQTSSATEEQDVELTIEGDDNLKAFKYLTLFVVNGWNASFNND